MDHVDPKILDEYSASKICSGDALFSGDLRKEFSKSGFNYKTTLLEVLERIQNYIVACLAIHANPTQHLKSFFPYFEWERVLPREFSDEDGLLGFLEEQDYAFALDGRSWQSGILVGRTKKKMGQKDRKKICYQPRNADPWPESLKETWIKVVHPMTVQR